MNDPVENINGVGRMTALTLANKGITTVGQLVEYPDFNQLQLSSKEKILARAKEYLEAHESKVEAAKPPPIVLGSFGQKVIPESKAHENTDKQPEPEQYLIANHSWFEQKILLPRSAEARELTEADVQDEYSLREAIVYDLSIEPHNRISFICSWMVAGENQDNLCTMTYSPQLLLHFNLDLPPLEVTMTEEDYKLVPNPQVLKNVLWEISVMQLLSGEE